MEFIKREVPLDFNLIDSGDWHIGTQLHYKEGFKKLLSLMNGEAYEGITHNLLVGKGDYAEAIDTSDKRFDVKSSDPDKIRPDQQYNYLRDKLKPFAHNVVTLLEGNHDWTIARYYPYVQDKLCNDLGIKYGTHTAVITFVHKGKKLFKMYCTHGNGRVYTAADDPIRQDSNLKLSIKRKLNKKHGDCIIMSMGHIHSLIVSKPNKTLYITSNKFDLKQNYILANQKNKWIHPDQRYYIASGSLLRTFKKGISGYAERAMYDPVELGFPIIRVRDGKIIDVDKYYV